jgi:ATP-dependent Zn protease
MRLTLFWALIIVVALVLWAVYAPQQNLKDVSFSDVINRANSGEIAKIEIEGDQLTVTPKGQSQPTERSYKESGSSIYEQGLKQDTKTDVAVKKPYLEYRHLVTASITFWRLLLPDVPPGARPKQPSTWVWPQ